MRRMVEGAAGGVFPLRLAALATSPVNGGGTLGRDALHCFPGLGRIGTGN